LRLAGVVRYGSSAEIRRQLLNPLWLLGNAIRGRVLELHRCEVGETDVSASMKSDRGIRTNTNTIRDRKEARSHHRPFCFRLCTGKITAVEHDEKLTLALKKAQEHKASISPYFMAKASCRQPTLRSFLERFTIRKSEFVVVGSAAARGNACPLVVAVKYELQVV
jgi:hypothetical protein